MKNLLSLLLAAAVLPAAFAQNVTIQKAPASATGANKLTDSSKVIVVGDGGSISATGTGEINATSVAGGSISPTAPLTGGGPIAGTVVIGIPKATSSVDGYLFHTDWATFNAKQSALSFTPPIVNSAGTVAMAAATGSVNGYLTSADWTTFNAKQAAGNYLTALTGDASASGPGSAALTLATVNSNVGSFGDSTHVATVTVNAKGLATAAGNATISGTGVLDGIGSTRGSVLYRGASGWAPLTPGTVNFALLSGGSGADPSYAAIVNSVAGTANQVVASGSSGAVTLSLSPTIAGVNSLTAAATTNLTISAGSGNQTVSINSTGTGSVKLTNGATQTNGALYIDATPADKDAIRIYRYAPVSGWEIGTRFNSQGAMFTNAWITVSGTGNNFTMPTADPFMIGINSDINGPAFIIGPGTGGGYSMQTFDVSNNYVFSVEANGDLKWGAGATRGSMDTTLHRVSANVLSVGGNNLIAAGAVTTSGLTMSTARILGRTTAATGAIEEISAGANLSLSAGTLNTAAALTGITSITGGAANMTITAGTGNSRTLALQTTTSGGTATTFLTGNADQSVTFAGAGSIPKAKFWGNSGVSGVQFDDAITMPNGLKDNVITFYTYVPDSSNGGYRWRTSAGTNVATLDNAGQFVPLTISTGTITSTTNAINAFTGFIQTYKVQASNGNALALRNNQGLGVDISDTSGNASVTSSTASTTSSTGALIVTGGAGIGGALNIGSTIDASVGGGSFTTPGGLYATKTIWAGTGFTGASLIAPASTDLTLTGGKVSSVSGGSVVLGQGANGNVTIAPAGTGYVVQTLSTDATRFLRKIDLSASTFGSFNETYLNTSNPVGSRNNRAWFFGYNTGSGSALDLSTEPSLRYGIESFYKTVDGEFVESYLDYQPISGSGLTAFRPWSVQANRQSNSSTFNLASTTIGLTGIDGTAFGQFNATGLIVSPTTDNNGSLGVGSLINQGGFSNAKNLYVGGNSVLVGTVNVDGAVTVANNIGVTDQTKAFKLNYAGNNRPVLSYNSGNGLQIGDSAFGTVLISLNGNLLLGTATDLSGNSGLKLTGPFSSTNTTDASNTTTAAAVFSGGLATAKKIYAGDDIHGIGNVLIDTAGKTLSVKSGSNAAAGTVTLVAGAATITSTAIDANTVILFSEKTAGGTPGVYQPLAAVSSGSAAVTSAATDTSTYNWVAMKVN